MKKVNLLVGILIAVVGIFSGLAQAGNTGQTENALPTDKIETLRVKLVGYVADATVLDDGLLEVGETSEFGRYNGGQVCGYGDIVSYYDKDYTLIISYIKVENNNERGVRILDFVLFGVKDNEVLELSEGYMCNVYRNDTPVCDEVSFVVVKDVGFDTDTPVIKAWKMGNKGKFADVDPTGLTWNASTP